MGCFRKDWLSSEICIILLLLLHTVLLSATLNSSSTGTDADFDHEKLVTLHIIAIVPTMDEVDCSTSLLSTQAEQVLENSVLYHGHRLVVVPVSIPRCDLNEGIVPFVEQLTSKENHIIGIVGYFCHNIAQHFSEILLHSETDILQISATSLNWNRVPHIRHGILPVSESTAKALVQLILRLGWSKVAVMSSQNRNFLDAKRVFLKEARQQGVEVISQFEISNNPHSSHNDYLEELQNTGAKIVLGFLPSFKLMNVLCTAYHHGFRWPHYAWIFTDLTIADEIPSFKHCYQRTAVDNLNGAIFLYLHVGNFHGSRNGLNNAANQNESLSSSQNPYQENSCTNVLYDSVRAIALSLNESLGLLNERNLSLTGINIRASQSHSRSEIMEVLEKQLSQLSFQGATGFLNFNHSAAATQISVELFQFQNQQPEHIGSYNFSLNWLILNETIIGSGDIPTDTLDRVYVIYPTYVTVLLMMMILMCFAMTIISMCLFFYFRNHPSIKATSSILSLCLFIGCYFLLSSSFHTINSGIVHRKKRKFVSNFRLHV